MESILIAIIKSYNIMLNRLIDESHFMHSTILYMRSEKSCKLQVYFPVRRGGLNSIEIFQCDRIPFLDLQSNALETFGRD